jgi:hypothetical protein
VTDHPPRAPVPEAVVDPVIMSALNPAPLSFRPPRHSTDESEVGAVKIGFGKLKRGWTLLIDVSGLPSSTVDQVQVLFVSDFGFVGDAITLTKAVPKSGPSRVTFYLPIETRDHAVAAASSTPAERLWITLLAHSSELCRVTGKEVKETMVALKDIVAKDSENN